MAVNEGGGAATSVKVIVVGRIQYDLLHLLLLLLNLFLQLLLLLGERVIQLLLLNERG